MKHICVILFIIAVCSISALEFDIPRFPASIDVSDIELDGSYDVTIGHSSSFEYPKISILTNFEDSEFTYIDTSNVFRSYVEIIQFANMDEDDFPDLVVLSGEIHDPLGVYLRIYYNNGYDIQAPTEYFLTSIPHNQMFVCADVNGDGLDDYVSAINQCNSWLSMINLGNQQFSSPIEYNLSFPPQNITSGDLTGNGIADILISGQPTIFSYLDGTWQSQILEEGLLNMYSEICDLDNDGDNDIVTYTTPMMGNDCELRIFENQSGQFVFHSSNIYSFPSALEVFDHNNDNLPDFLLANKLVTNLGDFTFSEPDTLLIVGNDNAFADMDHNGFLDILGVYQNYANGRGILVILFNDGNGHFLPEPANGIEEGENPTIPQIKLNSFPSPFCSTVTLAYELPKNDRANSISIFNIKGELVRTIPVIKSISQITWDGTDSKGRRLTSGIYFSRLKTNQGISTTHKLLLIK